MYDSHAQQHLENDTLIMLRPLFDNDTATIHGDVDATLTMSFLDYVDVDPNLPDTENGGDPFIFRARANIDIDTNADSIFDVADINELVVMNPDVDQDGNEDYTGSVFLSNVAHLGLNWLDDDQSWTASIREFLGLCNPQTPIPQDDTVERPAGKIDESPESMTAEAMVAETAIVLHMQQQEVDPQVIDQSLLLWFDGADVEAQPEGETGANTVLGRLRALDPEQAGNNLDAKSTDALEAELAVAVNNFLAWRDAAIGYRSILDGLVNTAQLTQAQVHLSRALDYAIERAHDESITLYHSGAPERNELDDQGQIIQRGWIDRAADAFNWALTADFVGAGVLAEG